MNQPVVILGAGAQARYLLNILTLTGTTQVLGLLDPYDNPALYQAMVDGATVLGGMDRLAKLATIPGLTLSVAIADLAIKREVVRQAKALGLCFRTVIHPSATLAGTVSLGEGCLIGPQVAIEPGTRLGRFVIVHAGCVVEHDNRFDDFVNLAPRVTTTGRVHIEEGAFIGAGAVILPDRRIGREAVVGAGAVVTRDVLAGCTVVGVPARPASAKLCAKPD